MKKTNAARILDKMKLSYNLREFSVDRWDLSAENAAELLNVSVSLVYKTLIARGDKNGVIIVSIPGGAELDLKALARVSGDKKVEMVTLKEIQPLTGYIRGAVSPLGMKQAYPYYLDESAFGQDLIIISAGIRGTQIEIAPADLQKAASAVTGKLTRV